jgi:hypothetical protein
MAFGVFLPQDVVDSWVIPHKVELAREIMTFRRRPMSLRLVPGYYFERVVHGSDDENRLLGRAKGKAALAALGAESHTTFVVLGETAYQVEDGFIARPLDPTCTRQALLAALAEAGC